MVINKNFIFSLIAFIIMMEGLSIMLLPNKSSFLLGFVLAFFGFFSLIYIFDRSILNYSLDIFEFHKSYFIYVGFFILISVFSLNYIILKNEFGQFDLLLLLVGLSWVTFNFIPISFANERNFMFVFLHVTFCLFLFQNLFFHFIDKTNIIDDWDFNEFFVHYILAKPLGNFLSILGYEIVVDRDTLIYYDTTIGHTQRVWIADDCSGIYSIFIFISFFITYLVVEYKKFDLSASYFFVLGIISAYFANILRMALIILAGHYRGGEVLQWAHVNVGWMLFTIWMFIFWIIIINTLGVEKFDFNSRIKK